MVGILFSHKWKQFIRSSHLGQSLATGIVLFIVSIYFLIIALLLGVGMGWFTETILADYGKHAASRFSAALPTLLILDFCLRYFFDSLPLVQTRNYLLHNVSKRFLLHFTLASSLFSFWNLFWAIILGIFVWTTVSKELPALSVIQWTIGWSLYLLISQFCSILFKRLTAFKSHSLLWVMGLATIIGTGQYLGLIDILSIGSFLMGTMGDHVWQLVIPIVGFILIYRFNYHFLRKNMYEDAWLQNNNTTSISGNFDFLDNRGIVGSLVAQELKLILRNKRTKTALYFSFVGLFYGLLVYNNPDQGYSSMWSFGGIITTGIFLINYGQYCFSWDSPAYDGWMTRNISVYDYVKSKWVLLSASVVITYLLTFPYLFMGWKVFWVNTVFAAYNLGVTTFLLMYTSTFDHKRLDLSKTNVFNYQGAGASQWIIMFPILLFPQIFMAPFKYYNATNLGLAILFLLSLTSFACHHYWINAVENNLQVKKYIKSQGYRQKANS